MTNHRPKRSRRGNNEGSIRFREDRQCWQAQVSIRGKRTSKTFKTRAEAQKWVREMQNSIESGLTAQIARSPLAEALLWWLDDGRIRWEAKTLEQYTNIVYKHIRPNIKKNLKVIDVKPYHVQELVSIADKNSVGVRTQKYIVTTLHTFFEDLSFQQIFQYNPAQGIRIEYEPPEMKTLNAEQVRCLLETAKDSRFEILYYIAITTGMREGELLGLKWCDVDWNSQSLLVQRQMQWSSQKKDDNSPRYIFKSPKSKSGIRRIALGPQAIDKLKIQRNRLAMQRIVTANRWEENDLVFPNLLGRPVEPTNLIREFKRVLNQANLPNIRIHDLRHTSATLMLLMNIHPKVVSERLGHSDIRITLQLYSHAVPTMQTEAAAKMDDLISFGNLDPNPSAESLADFEKVLDL